MSAVAGFIPESRFLYLETQSDRDKSRQRKEFRRWMDATAVWQERSGQEILRGQCNEMALRPTKGLSREDACGEWSRAAQRRTFRSSRMDSNGESHAQDCLGRFRRFVVRCRACRLSLPILLALGIGITNRMRVLLGPCVGTDPRPGRAIRGCGHHGSAYECGDRFLNQ